MYFHVAMFVTPFKVVRTFESVNETLVHDHSDQNYREALLCCSDYFALQRGSKFQFSDYYIIFLIKSNPYIP